MEQDTFPVTLFSDNNFIWGSDHNMLGRLGLLKIIPYIILLKIRPNIEI